MTKRTLILSGIADNYFFPALDNIDFVFKKPKSKRFITIAKIVRELHLPLLHLFYGKWKKDLKEYDKVIIFDLGYQPKMERYILRKNKKLEVFYYNWNPVKNNRQYKKIKVFYNRNNVYSTDKKDCEKYNIKYKNIFYSRKWSESIKKDSKEKIQHRCFWLGQNKGRIAELIKLTNAISKADMEVKLLVKGCDIEQYKLDREIDYTEYCKMIMDSEVLLDINQEGQNAMTLRVMESLFFQKKLITYNKELKKEKFYNPNNILVVENKQQDDDFSEQIKDFIARKFEPYDNDILDTYEVNTWIKSFVNDTSEEQ